MEGICKCSCNYVLAVDDLSQATSQGATGIFKINGFLRCQRIAMIFLYCLKTRIGGKSLTGLSSSSAGYYSLNLHDTGYSSSSKIL